jgi:nitrate/nitrite-specific signal transduction histidine kinase
VIVITKRVAEDEAGRGLIGRGFDPSAISRGVGLRSITERAKLLPGGHCDIASQSGMGCQITISWDAEETAYVS